MTDQIQICPFCGLSHPAEARFCPVTGQEFVQPVKRLSLDEVRPCPSCGAIILKSAEICPICGAGVAAAPPVEPLPVESAPISLPPVANDADTHPTHPVRRRRALPLAWIIAPLSILLCLGLIVLVVSILRSGILKPQGPVIAWDATRTASLAPAGTLVQAGTLAPTAAFSPSPAVVSTLSATASGTLPAA